VNLIKTSRSVPIVMALKNLITAYSNVGKQIFSCDSLRDLMQIAVKNSTYGVVKIGQRKEVTSANEPANYNDSTEFFLNVLRQLEAVPGIPQLFELIHCQKNRCTRCTRCREPILSE
jgi:hypothetical protein